MKMDLLDWFQLVVLVITVGLVLTGILLIALDIKAHPYCGLPQPDHEIEW
jgi:hypothetical protein